MATVNTRSGHPETSYWAAEKLEKSGSLTFIKAVIIDILRDNPKGLTDEQMRKEYEGRAFEDEFRIGSEWPKLAESTLRARRSELVAAGIVEPTGRHAKNSNGSSCRVWALTAHGQRL
jgi:hypothetical protein